MAQKKGLGRGLESLFSVYNNEEENIKEQLAATEKPVNTAPATKEVVVNKGTQGVQEINITEIDPNKGQPRKTFDEEAMNELAESIKVHGVIQPIIVVKRGNRHMIIAGERRWRASKLAGLKQIPVIVKDYSEKEIREVSIIENLQREDLNPIETAKAIKELMDEFSWTQEVVATRLGKSRSAIANTIRLLSLQPEVIQMIESGDLSAGHARSLVVVNDAKAQIKLAKMASGKKVTVRDLEMAVKTQNAPKKPAKAKKTQSAELKNLIQDMQRVFATKVTALGSNNRGRIYIDYYSQDDLDRIYQMVEKLKK